MGDLAIEIEGLRVRRGDKVVLSSLSTTVERGTVTGLLGPSGSGKTTLMRAIVGTQQVEAGTVRVLGRPAGDPALRRSVAYVTQAPSVYGDLTVSENLDYFARILDVEDADRARALRAVALGAQEGQLARSLSGGERTRLSLAVALLGEPELLVLDEPTVGLDPVLRDQLWRTFREIADAGSTLLVSSHVMDEADRCERLVLLREGTILAEDAPQALRRRTGAASMDEAFLALVRGVEPP